MCLYAFATITSPHLIDYYPDKPMCFFSGTHQIIVGIDVSNHLLKKSSSFIMFFLTRKSSPLVRSYPTTHRYIPSLMTTLKDIMGFEIYLNPPKHLSQPRFQHLYLLQNTSPTHPPTHDSNHTHQFLLGHH